MPLYCAAGNVYKQVFGTPACELWLNSAVDLPIVDVYNQHPVGTPESLNYNYTSLQLHQLMCGVPICCPIIYDGEPMCYAGHATIVPPGEPGAGRVQFDIKQKVKNSYVPGNIIGDGRVSYAMNGFAAASLATAAAVPPGGPPVLQMHYYTLPNVENVSNYAWTPPAALVPLVAGNFNGTFLRDGLYCGKALNTGATAYMLSTTNAANNMVPIHTLYERDALYGNTMANGVPVKIKQIAPNAQASANLAMLPGYSKKPRHTVRNDTSGDHSQLAQAFNQKLKINALNQRAKEIEGMAKYYYEAAKRAASAITDTNGRDLLPMDVRSYIIKVEKEAQEAAAAKAKVDSAMGEASTSDKPINQAATTVSASGVSVGAKLSDQIVVPDGSTAGPVPHVPTGH